MVGLELKEMGVRLGLSENTARSYQAHLRQALGLHNTAELCKWAYQHPAALAGQPVRRALHPEGCGCDAPYCTAMREAAPDEAEAA